LRELVKVFGPHRLIWGSDYPFVTAEEGGYADAVRVLERQIGDDPALLANIRGDNFLRLFPGALGEA
jgi:predicted TIM-barrel fold metal-dependent hydrolase